MKIVIADASCLITLDNIDEPTLLRKLYETVYVTPEVADEVGESLPDWVVVQSSSNRFLIDALTADLEIGEASSIVLALEIPDCTLIIDEKKGRRVARELGIEITGTFGLVATGIELGLIATPATILDRLEKVGFRISDALKDSLRTMIH